MDSASASSLALIIVAAVLAPLAAEALRRFRIPGVVLEIAFGVVIGQQVLGIAEVTPVVAGFGIKDAASAAAMAVDADGVVVGSALVSMLADAADPEAAAGRAREFLAPLRQAVDAG